MKKFFVIAAAVLTVFAAQSAFAIGVTVNGTAVRFNSDSGQPFAENGVTLVPLRAACEAYGAYVDFNPDTQIAVVYKDGITVLVPLGDNHVYRNGVAITNDVVARAVDGRTYLPIRVVMEALGANVDWNSRTQTVVVEDPDQALIKSIEREAGGNNTTNKAIALLNKAKAYANSGQYHMSALAYERSAYYWSQVPGQSETARNCANKAKYVDTDVRLFLKTDDPAYDTSKYFGAPCEPKSGLLLGATDSSPSIDYLTGIEHGLILQYFDFGARFSNYDSWFKSNKSDGKVIEIGWQPQAGMASVTDTDYIIAQAKYLESTGAKILMRFANEMNDVTCAWYTDDYNLYIEKFRMVADIFHTYAPSVAMVWAPNFYPADTVDLYYPGDSYVDYVGLSVYQEFDPNNDPLEQGIDRGRWADVLDQVYNTYADRKPIIISEAGCSAVSAWTGADITDFAVSQMENFYTYIPIKYPNLKMSVLFIADDAGGRQFRLDRKPALLEAYMKGISTSKRYIFNVDEVPAAEFYYELHHNFTVPAKVVELCSYISAPVSGYDYVIYTINGVDTPTYAAPYTAMFDFTPYAGQTLNVQVRAFGNGTVLAEETYKINVQ